MGPKAVQDTTIRNSTHYTYPYYKIVPKVMNTFILQWNEGIHTETNDMSKI